MPSEHREQRSFRLGEWLVQPSLGRVSNSSAEVQLEPRTMELLVFLAENAGEAVTRQQIIDTVWPQEFVGDAALSTTIARLRRALGDDARSPRYIETLPKRGYRMLPRPVDVLEVVARPGGEFRVGDWLVEPSRNRMTLGDATLELEQSTMDVLLCLAERAGEPVPRNEIVERVWRTESVSEFTVSSRIEELQRALGDSGGDPGYIEAVPERGFRLAAAVAVAEPSATVTPFLTTKPGRDPYPGLAAFTEADAKDFFGREAETAAMWRRISGRRLLAVAGPSGVGKSSFLLAGVIPAAPPGWGVLVCAPGEAPFLSLARALAPEAAGDDAEVEQLLSFDDPAVAFEVLSRWRQRREESLLIVDQFEELFTLNPPGTRTRFIDLILRLATEARVHVVLVLRDDFLRSCQAHPPLAPVFKDLTMLGPPGAGDLWRALVEPARSRGYSFEDDALPDEMVASLAEERGALPLLAFAARQLWELRDDARRLLTRQSYQQIGGVGGALAQHAEATLDAIGRERLPVVRELFRNLVTAQGTRARRSVDDLLSVFAEPEAAEQVLQALIGARLLTSFEEEIDGEAAESPRRVEIVHESLLREWPRLLRWQTQDADAAQLRDQLRQAAQLWQARGRPAELLWTGAPYRELTVWQESYPGGLSATEAAFADAMGRHAARRRRRRRLVVAAALMVAAAVAAVTTGLWRRAEVHARRLEARRLYQLAERAMDWSPPTALAYAVASLERMDAFDVRRLALRAVHGSPMPLVLGRDQAAGLYVGADFSPDGRWLLVGDMKGHLSLWPSSGGPPVVWQAHEGSTRGYFAPDSRTLYSGSPGDRETIAWAVPEARRMGVRVREEVPRYSSGAATRRHNTWRRLIRWVRDPSAPGGWRKDRRAADLFKRLPGDRHPAAALGPDGSQLVYALGETLYRTSVEEPAATPTELGRCRAAVEHVAFHPDGERLATLHTDGSLQLWSLSSAAVTLLREWPSASDDICHDLRFDPSGTLLVAAFGARATVWQVDEPLAADPLRLAPAGGRMVELAFHPDGRWLATASLRRVSLWPLDRTRYPYVLRGHSGPVERAVFAPDGSWLASIGTDGTVRQWPLQASAGAHHRVLFDWGHPVQSVAGWLAMSPDGRYVVTTGQESAARLVPVDGSAPEVLGGFDKNMLRAAVGRDGRLVAVPGVAGGRRVIRLWNRETGNVTDVDLGEGGSSFIEVMRDGRMLLTMRRKLHLVDPATGRYTLLAEDVGGFTLGGKDTLVLSRQHFDGKASVASVHDLETETRTPLTSHGSGVVSLALDATSTIAVTGSSDGIVRVGPVSGSTPRWLAGHVGTVATVAVSADGRFIASGGSDGTIRVWPMPDLSRPPLYDLPRAELVARLGSLTNLRVVADPDDPGGYLVQAGPFPGWQTVPEW